MTPDVPFTDAARTLEFGRILEAVGRFCVSDAGRERVAAIVPSAVFAEVRDALDLVAEMRLLLDADDAPPLEDVPDCRPSLHRAAVDASVLPAEDVRAIRKMLGITRSLKGFFEKRRERTPLLGHIAATLTAEKMLEYHIDRAIDEEGGVRDGASKELRSLRRELLERSGQLRRRMEGILKRVSSEHLVQEELVTLRDGRMVLPVKNEFKRQVPGFIHSSSASGQTVYVEPAETLELNNDIRDLQFSEAREIAKILSDLTARIRPEVPALLASVDAFAHLDAIAACTRYGMAYGCSVPVVENGGALSLVRARHPVLLLHKKPEEVVPLDLSIGDPESTVIITGPNAGGKSVAMKTVGLLALMAQSGIPVPCDESSRFPVYRDVFVDIGDEQSVEHDLSTFSAHIHRLARIVASAGERTLALIDEIGTGTDPAEGSALAAAILEELTARRTHAIATTHHGMLKAFAHEHPSMRNAAMEFDLATLQPTYVFRAGLPGSSYAFEITRRHGMDERIIARAREVLGTRADALERLLAEVERTTQERAAAERDARERERRARALEEEYRSKLEAAKSESRALRQRALEEADRITAEANALIEQTVREIREAEADRERVKEVRRRVETYRHDIARERSTVSPGRATPEPAAIRAGDRVALRGNPASIGAVLEAPRGGDVAVAFGNVRMRVPLADLQKVDAASMEVPPPLVVPNVLPARPEIDVRGMYGDEAVAAVDAFLADAYAAGLHRVDIIHGKGTGALRKRIQEYLRTEPTVESFRLGEWNEGMTGVTVVQLKSE